MEENETTKYTEDDGLIYDYESDWRPCNSGSDKRIIFTNVKRSSLFRIIDFTTHLISFSDVERVVKIVDINKVLVKEDDEEENKSRFQALVNRILDEIRPITMPYHPEQLKCFIENFPGFDENYHDTLGILYFKEIDSDEMIACKRFFRIHPIGVAGTRYEELTFETYNDVKQKWMRRCEDAEQ